MKRPLALALLALACGCGDRPAKTYEPPPATNTSTAPAPAPAPVTSGPDGAGSPGRFIVCPGDRRCPRRKDGKPTEGGD